MEIKNIIVHEIKKEQNDENLEIILRPDENPIDELSNELIDSLSSLFGRTGLSFGEFGLQSGTKSRLQERLEELTESSDGVNNLSENFLELSKDATGYLAERLSTQSKGGYLLFYLFEYQDKIYLNIVLLRKTVGLTLDSELSLDQIERLDLDKLHMAGSINLDDWMSGNVSKYICFKKSSRARDVTDYFSTFIGVSEYQSTAKDTQNLIDAVVKYCRQNNFSAERVEETRQSALTYCNEKHQNEEPVILESFSAFIDGENPSAFLELAQGDEFGLTNEIFLEKRVLNKFVRIKIKKSSINLTFETGLLQTNDFNYNKEDRSLTVTINDLNDATVHEIEASLNE